MSTMTLIAKSLWAGTPVLGGAVLTSAAVDVGSADVVEALRLRVSSVVGVASAKVQYQTSQDNVHWDVASDNADIVTSTLLAKAGNPEGFNSYPLPAPLARYMRIVLTEISAAVLADTLVDGALLLRQGLS
mgnify:CR=1 FL=1